jgi:hypothetical protein
MDGWMDGWMDEWMDGWMDRWLNKLIRGQPVFFNGPQMYKLQTKYL